MASPKLDTTRHSSSHFKASGGGLKNLASLGNSASSLNNLETTQNDEEIHQESENNSTSITTVSKKVITKSNVLSVSDFVNKMDKIGADYFNCVNMEHLNCVNMEHLNCVNRRHCPL